MKYEATINFEVKEKLDLSGVEVTGRTDDGEVVEQMAMFRGGTVDWTDEAKVRIAETTKEIVRRLDVDEETANRLWEGMADVYETLASKGLSAFPGGEQSVRVIPEALQFIRRRADALPEED